MNRNSHLAAVIGAFMASAGTGLAVTEWQLGRGSVALFTSASATYDSNLQASPVATDDFYFALTPLAKYRRADSIFTSDASLSFTAQRYLEETQFDNNSLNFSYVGSIPRDNERTYGANIRFGYDESVDADADINRRVASESFSAGAGFELMVARAHLLSTDASYRMVTRDFGSDQTTWGLNNSYAYSLRDGTSIGARYGYTVTETESDDPSRASLDQASHDVAANVSRTLYAGVRGSASVGYRWLDRGDEENQANLPDTEGYTMSVGLDGQFLPKRYFPKTTGQFRVAYESAVSPGLNDGDSKRLVGSINVQWQARETTSVGVGVARAQDLSASDQTVVTTTVSWI